MLKIFLILLLMTSQAWSSQWRGGTGENTLRGASNASDIDTNTFNSIVNPLDNLLSTYCNQYINYSSGSQLSISAGSVTVSNSDSSIRLMLKNSNSTTIDFTNIDTGVEASSTTYYVYAVATSASDTSATYKISASSTAPSGITFYYQLGSFFNDSSSNISAIVNNYVPSYVGTSTSKSANVIYQALTDGFLTSSVSFAGGGTIGTLKILSDSSSSPSTIVDNISADSGGGVYTLAVKAMIRKGDYYEVTITNGNSPSTNFEYFIPTSK